MSRQGRAAALGAVVLALGMTQVPWAVPLAMAGTANTGGTDDGAATATAGGGALGCAAERITLLAEGAPVVFDIEIADDPEEQARGLMFRQSLPREAGMLFVYSRPQPASFWMKNTMIPLDMIFIDDSGRVLNIAAETVPYSLAARSSEGVVRAVLEINGGLAAELGIGPGTQALHPAFEAAPEGLRCPAE
ncbi:hypothetical protein LNKW23_38820 [Paralimibaculum aggregatum]|uniref:DUF192 domain-containing protein n=1 Tax=Paralimibaculum aggregatum TaxID=3036245 RepID=A0ABQ6LS70_9RHOB|nr:DUF192 domain-containing protein [Limibaculum sp. NKW23]GMG84666.1 hypothetical protein LNKW23_38820 [Limibaculum sp. NKW23]